MSFFQFARQSSRSLKLCTRHLSSTAASEVPQIRAQLLTELKKSMKEKNTLASTTLRSVISEMNNADKTDPSGKISPSAVIGLLRKAKQRREEAGQQYISGQRPDLAEKEQLEVQVIDKLLPPLLPVESIDTELRALVKELSPDQPAKKRQGLLIKAFYERVDRALVDPAVVAQRANALLTNESS